MAKPGADRRKPDAPPVAISDQLELFVKQHNGRTNVQGMFLQPMRHGICVDCGYPTEIINRSIGFFGLIETHCTYCRDCLPEDRRREHDDLVAAAKANKSYYARQMRKFKRRQR